MHGLAQAHDADSQTGPLGKVSFPTSCDAKVQPAFERAVAMLHSFWYSAGEQAFRDVLKDDPQCAIATICDSLNFDFFIGPPWMQNPARKVHL